jgi:hypothetical protein
MEALTALRARLGLSILALAGAAMLVVLSPADARAECVSSTPAESITTDAAADHVGDAPDIRELRVTLGADCTLTVRPVNTILPLLDWQFLIVSFDLDGDDIEDRYVSVFGIYPALDDGTNLPFVDSAGFSVTLDELGVTTSPTEIGMAVETWYFNPVIAGSEYLGDYHPELTEPMVRLPISFATPPPPPPPPPPAPAAPAPPAAPAAIKQTTGCKVPKLKGLTVKKAKAALKKAGCKYKLKGKGRVRSFSPKAGTTTKATVQVKCKSKKRKKRSRKSALRIVQYR